MGRILALGMTALVALTVAALLAWKLATAVPAPAPTPGVAPPTGGGPTTPGDPEADPALIQARDHVELARRERNVEHEVVALHRYAILLRDRRRITEAGATLCEAIGVVCAQPDLAARPPLLDELRMCGGDLINVINRELATRVIGLEQALAWYGAWHDAVHRAGRIGDAAQIRHNMASLAMDGERDADALRWIDEAIAGRERLLSEHNDPHAVGPLAWSLALKGHALYKAKRYEEALVACNAALAKLAYVEGRSRLTEPGKRAIDTMALCAHGLIEATQADRALQVWREVWSGAREASASHQEAVLSHAVTIHARAGDLDGARAAVEGLLNLNSARRIAVPDPKDPAKTILVDGRQPDVDATIWYDFARTLMEYGGDPDEALRWLDQAAARQREIGWELGLGWTWHERGRILLRRAADKLRGDAARAADARDARSAFAAARTIFERCGQHRNGLMKSIEGQRDAARAAGAEPESEVFAAELQTLLASEPPTPLERADVGHADPVWNDLYDKASPVAPVARVYRDSDEAGSWVVIDELDPDHPRKRIPFDWGWRDVDVKRVTLTLAGQHLLTGQYKLFLPKGYAARVLRSGAVQPLGRAPVPDATAPR